MSSYTDVIKIVIAVGMFFLWCMAIQWVDRDGERVKTVRERWNILCLATGFIGLFAWLVMPVPGWAGFTFGWGIYAFLAGGGLLMYVSHRNKRVSEDYRVLTSGHIKRLVQNEKKQELDRSKHDYRVRLFKHDKKPVILPSDFDGAEKFTSTQEILYDAMWRRASEVDLSAFGENTRLTYKIDGVMAERKDFISPQQAVHAVTYIKDIAGLDAEERRRPQKGTMRAALLGTAGDPSPIDVHTSGTTAGERMKLKILSAESLRPISELGIHHQRLERLQEILATEQGIVLVSGPPESGVTTTLYAIIKTHDAYIQNIHSLEKRRLFEVDNVTQNIFDPGKNDTSYARQLQSVLRREPDLIMVGEMDDKETARMAVRASRDGRKVYAGLTATDTFDAMSTFLDWVDDHKTAADGLGAVLNQRLLRKLCPTCREAYKPDANLLRKANLPADTIEHFYRTPTQKIYDKQGREIVCPTCQGSGYVGRIGIFEILIIDDAIRAMIRSGANVMQIKAQARKEKMYYLQEEGLLKTMEGMTSMNEVIRGLQADGKARR